VGTATGCEEQTEARTPIGSKTRNRKSTQGVEIKRPQEDSFMQQMMTKYIVRAFTPRKDVPWKEDEVLIDLVELTNMDAMVKIANREGVEGIVLKTDKPRTLYFVDMDSFVKFTYWKFVLEGE
tara:strand:+ start:1957 stop:2325 length:369 start_codon:yes stop_codon:yes gene_type:complete